MECLLIQAFAILLILVMWDKLLGRKKTGFQWELGPSDHSDAPTLKQVQQAYDLEMKSAMNRPGRFKVIGIDRASGYDTVEFVQAQSAQNAKAKSERNGVIVTSVWPDME